MKNIIAIVVFALVAISCSQSVDEHKDIVNQMSGMQIVFPTDLTYQVGNTRIDLNPSEADFKIIVYIDSAGCTTCKMRMTLWNEIISEYKALTSQYIELLMILNTHPTEEYFEVIKDREFNQPVCFDPENSFAAHNSLPDNSKYHSFLLNSNDSIIAIGNPAENPKIRELYKKIITSDERFVNPPKTLCENNSRTIGVVYNGLTYRQKFILKNEIDSLLTVQDIIPSCECLHISVSSDSIISGDEVLITVRYTPQAAPSGSFSQYLDVYFNERELPERLYIHGYVVDTG